MLFDVDDLMVDPDLAVVEVVDGIRSQGLTEAEAGEWFGKMGRTAAAADACICTTPALARSLRRLGSPVHVLPNGYDDDLLVRSRLARRARRQLPHDGFCRIGYASGSLTHQRDFAVVAPAVADVLVAHPHTRLVVFRGGLDLQEFPELDDLHHQVEWREIVPLDALPVELARLDVNLAPLEVGNHFCEAKSELKHFEAALVDVPTVASPTEPYRHAIVHGVDGLLASTTDEWRASLTRLVEDEDLRLRIGCAARQAVLWDRGPDRRAQRVRAILEQVLRADGGPEAFELELERASRPRPPAPELVPRRIVLEHDSLRASPVTVVVPVHDYADVVMEALDSVRRQTLPDLDLVIVDDGSTDGSVEVVLEWLRANGTRFNRAVLLVHEENAGVAAARNSGFDEAATPYVLPLDADNILLPGCCEALLEAVHGSSAAYAYPRIRHIGEPSELFPDDHVRGYLAYAPQRLVGSNHIDAMALVRVSAWAGAGGYRSGCAGWEDYDLWCRFAELGLHGVRVADDLALYRVHDRSMLHTVTHRAGELARVRGAITARHAWLDLDDPPAGSPPNTSPGEARTSRTGGPRTPRPSDRSRSREPTTEAAGMLSERARKVLPLLRCPLTGEQLVADEPWWVRSEVTGHRWPIVAGRPNLFPGRSSVEVMPGDHRGNPLAVRARDLLSQATGWALHLSGGGTSADLEHVVELDATVFRATDVVGDAHQLPFEEGTFDVVVAMNAFEHYRDPRRVADEIRRVLCPGGLVLVHTAFLQPLHEAPHHYFNCTRYGLEEWFAAFDTIDVGVSDNFHPAFALSWFAAQAEEALARQGGAAAAFRSSTMGAFADLWRDSASRGDDLAWQALAALPSADRETLAAGFEYLGRRPS